MANGEVSFDPDEAQEGGGGIVQAVSGATLTFECVSYDYNGSVAIPVPALHVHGEGYQDEEGNDASFDEYYSAGDASKLRPKKDGTGFQALTEGAGLTKSCKAMQLLSSIVSANGGDKSLLTANIKDLDGINVDMERKPDIDRPGLEKKPGGRGRTILVVTAINALPGEAAPKKKGGKPAPKGAAPKPGGKAAALKAKTVEAVKAVLEGTGGEVSSEDLPQILFRKYKKDPDVKAMTELAADEDFLGDNDDSWSYEDNVLTAVE